MSGGNVRDRIELDNAVATELAGSEDTILRTLEGHLGCAVFLRGNVLTLDGDEDAVRAGAAVVRELSELISQGHEIAAGTIEAVSRALDQNESPASILEDVVWRHRATKVAPKTVNQKRYVDSIRANTITFGIGPAGTGKTFLAVALAAAALHRREVNRIILTRPAVEAGERLGFLPGDLMAKVYPYLRPLFDALHDMLEAERVTQHLERGVIEVAPLAFMRGRTLNDSFIILDEAQNTSPEQMKMFLTRLGSTRGWWSPATSPRSTCPRIRSPVWWSSARSSTGSMGSSSCASARRTSSVTSSCGGSSPPTQIMLSARRRSCSHATAQLAASIREDEPRPRHRGDRRRLSRCRCSDGARGQGAVRAGARFGRHR